MGANCRGSIRHGVRPASGLAVFLFAALVAVAELDLPSKASQLRIMYWIWAGSVLRNPYRTLGGQLDHTNMVADSFTGTVS